MTKKICLDCGEDMVDNAEFCQYCHGENISENGVMSAKLEIVEIFKKAGRYEEAAKLYDQLEMRDEAEVCRRMGKRSRKKRHVLSTNLKVGKVAAISMKCPYCDSSQLLDSESNVLKVNEVVCSFCTKKYVLPKKVYDLVLRIF